MAKRYYQSIRDRVHEGVGEDMYLLKDSRSERARRAHAMYESGMIDEDRSAIANLPQDVKMRSYARSATAMTDELDDTERGVDKQVGRDASQARAHMKPHKY